MRKLWRIWAKALGEKSGKTDDESDQITLLRTLIVLVYVVANIALIANVIHHW